MSLDLTLTQPRCDFCRNPEEDVGWFNYTYNLAPVWYRVYPKDEGMIQIEGLTGKESLLKLTTARNFITNNKEDLKKYVRGDGRWGNIDNFIEFLNSLIEQAEEFPNAIWSASR
jgi:hypothetical protein